MSSSEMSNSRNNVSSNQSRPGVHFSSSIKLLLNKKSKKSDNLGAMHGRKQNNYNFSSPPQSEKVSTKTTAAMSEIQKSQHFSRPTGYKRKHSPALEPDAICAKSTDMKLPKLNYGNTLRTNVYDFSRPPPMKIVLTVSQNSDGKRSKSSHQSSVNETSQSKDNNPMRRKEFETINNSKHLTKQS